PSKSRPAKASALSNSKASTASWPPGSRNASASPAMSISRFPVSCRDRSASSNASSTVATACAEMPIAVSAAARVRPNAEPRRAAGQGPASPAQSPAPSAEATGNGTGPKRSRRGRPGYDRETLINKATEVFVARGYDGTSMDTVARELGITKSAIYHHVKSKEELLHLAINRGIDALDSAVEAESHRTGITALERLRLAVRASVVILIEYHHSVTLLLRVRGNSRVELEALEQRR